MRLKIRAIDKPVKDYAKEEREREELLAKLPIELQEKFRKDEAEANAKWEAERLEKIAAYEVRWQAWLKARGFEGIEEQAEASDDFNDPVHGKLMELNAEFHTVESVENVRDMGIIASALKPVWIDVFEYWLIDGNYTAEAGPFKKMEKAGRIRVPLAVGDGSITLAIESEKIRFSGAEKVSTFLLDRRSFSGTIEGAYVTGALVKDHDCEAISHWIELEEGSQAIADKLARYFDKVFAEMTLPADLSVILAPSDSCFVCGRALDDPISKALWIGPTCAKKLGAPHNSDAARLITEKRRKFSCEAAQDDDALYAELLAFPLG